MTTHPIIQTVLNQQTYFNSLATRSYDFRVRQLQTLKQGILKFEAEFTRALKQDLGKPEFESYASEIGFSLHEIGFTIKHLKKWMRPRRVKTPLLCQPASSRIHYTPLGVNLIIAPFNYPVGLTLGPLTAAIAAGNTAVLKTSELTPHCSAVIRKMIEDGFDPAYIAYIPGEIPETTLLLEQKFDHIFFTGSPRVGAIVMQAAAKTLTPVTLELGGKSPCIVHSDARLNIAANRIVYGKFFNTGQTCIAPDYVLVHETVAKDFLKALTHRITRLYGKDPLSCPDYGRIVNQGHFKRIMALINPDKIVVGGQHDEKERFIAPTVMANVTLDDKVMAEEIFGPVLPVLTYTRFDDIYNIIGKLPSHPLACYLFSESKKVQEEVMSRIPFGGGSINHCLQHFINPHLPFGGIGESGMGSYHGVEGFERFSHKKSILKAGSIIDLPLGYPPYKKKLGLLKRFMR